ncbi:MAG: hypothetical protein JST47_12755 [Bacteroidetes bacterium]|nr:hypothetical protein [Bacteroidota bacterium]MBS1975480.1 hypothetical protein [Bacteroidota bacterium]
MHKPTSIVISGSDVYISGFEQNTVGKQVAKYWKNGTEVLLSDESANEYANSIAVSGNTIFVCGFKLASTNIKYPVEWVNGTEYIGTLGSGVNDLNGANNFCVVAANNQFYLAGTSFNNDATSTADRWSHTLPFAYVAPTFIASDAQAYAVAVSGTDVYTAGTFRASAPPNYYWAAYYWKNNVPYPLTDGSKNAAAIGISFSGSDLYVCGYEIKAIGSIYDIACYWKNGARVNLGDGNINTIARGIAAKGKDVYVSGNNGYFKNAVWQNHGYLWKNGVVIDSTSESGAMLGVAVGQ